jgi:sporulation protein YlmC with PRC-barrel domain
LRRKGIKRYFENRNRQIPGGKKKTIYEGAQETLPMRLIQLIGLVNLALGFAALLLPVSFYTIASEIFTPSVSPPFSLSLIDTITQLLYLPSAVLFLNGIAFLFVGTKLRRVAELKVFSEAGEYIGRLKGVQVQEGEVEVFEIEGKEGTEEYPKESVTAVDRALILKGRLKDLKRGLIPRKGHEMVGKEVYDQLGKYHGKVDSVLLDEEGKLSSFVVRKGDRQQTFPAGRIESWGVVVLLKSEEEA